MVSRLPVKALMIGIAAALVPTVASAHVGVGSTSGFSHGFWHPISGIDHVLAMVAVGMFAANLGGRALWAVPLTFVALMAAGGVLGIQHVNIPYVEVGIGLSVVILGLVVAFQVQWPVAAAMALVGVFAIFHGHAHGEEMPLSCLGRRICRRLHDCDRMSCILSASGSGSAFREWEPLIGTAQLNLAAAPWRWRAWRCSRARFRRHSAMTRAGGRYALQCGSTRASAGPSQFQRQGTDMRAAGYRPLSRVRPRGKACVRPPTPRKTWIICLPNSQIPLRVPREVRSPFLLCVIAVVIWALSGPFFNFSETWQLVINTATTIITFLMVFLIQNTQNRDGAALQTKLDELIRTSNAEDEFIGIEKLTDQELEALHVRCEVAAKRATRC